MRCFLFILLFSLSLLAGTAFADVIFTSERCNRVTYGLRTVNGDPSRYKQCGPSGRVWIVPCAPQMTFDPEDRVCKERPDPKVMKPMRKYEVPKTIITTPAPVPASYPVSAEVTPAASPAAAPEEFVFSTIRPKSRKPKARTRNKTKKTTVAMTTVLTTDIPMVSSEMTTPKIVIFASKKGSGGRSGERTNIREGPPAPAFPRPGRVRTTTMPTPVTHATRFVAGIQKITLPPKETQGMPHTLAPYEKMERRVESFGGEDMTTMTPEYTVRYNGKTMTENEFLNQLLHIVQHQKAVSERQQQDKFDRMEQERLRQEKEERAKELDRRRQLEEAERTRQAELERQAAIYAEQERMAMERERELERIRQEEITMEMNRMRELERLQMERQQKNEKVRQALEEARKQKIVEEERQMKIQEQMREMERIREEQEEARQRELRRLEEEREQEMQRVRQEEEERQRQMEMLRQQEEERKRKKLEREEKERLKAIREEERKKKILEKEMEQRRQELMEEERKRNMMEKEMEERQKAIMEEERRRKAEEERRKEKEMEERRQAQERMQKATEERSRLETMEREREMMMQIIDSERGREMLVTTPISTIKPIYRPLPITEYQPPDVEPHMIRFTTQAPEWATLPPKWQPEWNTVTVEEETSGVPKEVPVAQKGCQVSGECELKYDHDSFCAHPSNPSMYLQCAPLYGRLGRWTERYCPDTLVFLVSVGRCEKGEESRRPYDPDNRVVIPRLPSETSFVEWTGNRVIDHQIPVSPPRVYPPVPETHQPQIYNTIDEFPKDLLPRIPEVSPADTYAQQYQNHIHGSVISGGGHVHPAPTIAPIPIVPSSYQIIRSQIPAHTNNIKSEIDLSHIHPLFPRVQPDFLSRILPSLNLKMHDANSAPQSLGSVVKPVIKQIALNQTEQFLDRLLADQVQDKELRKELIDRLKSSNESTTTAKPPN